MASNVSTRTQILANLYGERAHFLHAIVGLAPSQLDLPLWDDWSIRRILPHIALWDTSEADRLRKIASGHAADIDNIDVPTQNEAWHQQYQALPVAEGVVLLSQERDGFLQAFAALTDTQRQDSYATAHNTEFSPMSCINNGIEHDQDHANDVTAWRKQHAFGLAQGPKSILLAAMQAGLDDFEATAAWVAERVSAETPICGHWNLTQLIAHMASWETYALTGLEQRAAPPLAMDDAAMNAENEELVNARLSLPLDQIWDEYRVGRQRAIEIIRNMTDEELAQPLKDAWSEHNTPYLWYIMWIEHDLEHTQELREMLSA